MKRSKRFRWLLTAATLLMMAVIFLFSCQNGEESDKTSGFIAIRLLYIVFPEADMLSGEAWETAYTSMQFMVRKLAHLTEYALLGLLLRLTAACWFPEKRTGAAAFSVGVCYAGTDELHQLLTARRTGMWQDVVLDAVGVLTGLIAALAILYAEEHKKRITHDGSTDSFR